MTDITIPPEALEAAARAMAKAGYGFAGIELTDPYTADADYWDHTARAAIAAAINAWPGMTWACRGKGTPPHLLFLPLPTEKRE